MTSEAYERTALQLLDDAGHFQPDDPIRQSLLLEAQAWGTLAVAAELRAGRA